MTISATLAKKSSPLSFRRAHDNFTPLQYACKKSTLFAQSLFISNIVSIDTLYAIRRERTPKPNPHYSFENGIEKSQLTGFSRLFSQSSRHTRKAPCNLSAYASTHGILTSISLQENPTPTPSCFSENPSLLVHRVIEISCVTQCCSSKKNRPFLARTLSFRNTYALLPCKSHAPRRSLHAHYPPPPPHSLDFEFFEVCCPNKTSSSKKSSHHQHPPQTHQQWNPPLTKPTAI